MTHENYRSRRSSKKKSTKGRKEEKQITNEKVSYQNQNNENFKISSQKDQKLFRDVGLEGAILRRVSKISTKEKKEIY